MATCRRRRLAATTAVALLCTAAVAVRPVGSTCPNMCSGHGDCSSSENRCSCWIADRHTDTYWIGGDCSLRECPKGVAWSDVASGVDVAHQPVQCSNRGTCDHLTGNCRCDPGFMGLACNRMACENDCGGHGVCKSMEAYARGQDAVWAAAGYSGYEYTTPWDSDMIYGCECDTGFTGYDCSQRLCPTGDDPLTTGQLLEVQQVTCQCASPSCTGFITLKFRGETTRNLAESASQSQVLAALLELSTVADASVSFTSATACGTASPNSMSITFTQNFGDVPMLTYSSTLSGTAVTITETTPGTRESESCSGRGSCNFATGVCSCYSGYDSSDGEGVTGARGDCGATTTTIGTCPGDSVPCSGHGYCSGTPTYTCTCQKGWTGGNCALRLCPSGPAWFDAPSADNTAHAQSECSNMGICNRATGVCACRTGFSGSACQYMNCPGTTISSTLACSGHGQCLDMRAMARTNTVNGELAAKTYGLTANDNLHWDSESSRGCICDAGFTGYDCASRICPYGDDPMTGKRRIGTQHNEKRHFKCVYTNAAAGTFALQFRDATTSALDKTASASDLKAALELLPSIDSVNVEFSSGFELCTADGSNVVAVTFLTQLGGSTFPDAYTRTPSLALPNMTITNVGQYLTMTSARAVGGSILDSSGVAYVDIVGNKEFHLCSDRGLCNFNTGICSCFRGYGSSNGVGGEGTVGDCGFVEPYVPVLRSGRRRR